MIKCGFNYVLYYTRTRAIREREKVLRGSSLLFKVHRTSLIAPFSSSSLPPLSPPSSHYIVLSFSLPAIPRRRPNPNRGSPYTKTRRDRRFIPGIS